MNNNIYPLAYTLSPGRKCTLYYLAFPEEWKKALLKIEQEKNPHFKKEYGLPTNALKKLINSWLEGVVALAPLKEGSNDEHWLTSCNAYTEENIEYLCNLIKVWVKATYVASEKAESTVKVLANEFCDLINDKELAELKSEAEICLTFEDGTVCEEAYQTIPLLAINRLIGKEIILNGQKLHLCYSAKNQLISQPITNALSQHKYSFVFDFSVQTTPPKRKALLLCQMRIRRWTPGRFNKNENIHLKEGINAHVKVTNNKYCQVPIVYIFDEKKIDWKQQDKKCYDFWGYKKLPEAVDVLKNPENHIVEILLPYKNGMDDFVISKIGTGVSVVDKASLYRSFSDLLGDIIDGHPAANRIKTKSKKIPLYNSPQEYSSRKEFREWVQKCAGTDKIKFELYGLLKDKAQKKLLEQIKEKIYADFGEESSDSPMDIQYSLEEVGSLADGIQGRGKDAKEARYKDILKILEKKGKPDTVTACIFIIESKNAYKEYGDPKNVIRNAFANTGRIVQFITMEDESNRHKGKNAGEGSFQEDIEETAGKKHKIESTVYDLYRQLGVVTLINPQKKMPSFAKVPCVGMHICTQIKAFDKRKARFLPLYVTVNLLEGKTSVQCDAFSEKTVTYREACLEMAKLYWKSDLKERCEKAKEHSSATQKLIELRNLYDSKDGLFVVHSDRNTRALWSGISDKEISKYAMTEEGVLPQINAGMPKKEPYFLNLAGQGVRVVRIRSNEEVPDYYTESKGDKQEQYSSTSGIFKYEDVFWCIHARPNDRQYTASFKESKIESPQKRFAEKDMIEIYPLQLQDGDSEEEWVCYTNALRHISIQYNQSTILPLPLHLAKALEEYLYDE